MQMDKWLDSHPSFVVFCIRMSEVYEPPPLPPKEKHDMLHKILHSLQKDEENNLSEILQVWGNTKFETQINYLISMAHQMTEDDTMEQLFDKREMMNDFEYKRTMDAMMVGKELCGLAKEWNVLRMVDNAWVIVEWTLEDVWVTDGKWSIN